MPSVRWVDMKLMRSLTKRFFFLLVFWTLALMANAQNIIHGYVVDQQTGDGIPFATIVCKSSNSIIKSDSLGRFLLPRSEQDNLAITAVGYKKRRVRVSSNTPEDFHVVLYPDSRHIEEVVVNGKRVRRYRRKDNPAVELMRKVIEAKKANRLTNRDYFQYKKYQKLTLAINNITQKDLEGPMFQSEPWLLNYVEPSPLGNNLILPISVDETVSRHLYKRRPQTERDIIEGQNSKGVGQLIQTGENLNILLKEYFQDVDIYDDQIEILQQRFPSPIGATAISFYHFYIDDTLRVEGDSCIRLQFTPTNQQDFGFRGELYVMADSTYRVKRCDLQLPGKTGVNFIESLRMEQLFGEQSDGNWVLTTDNMIVELQLTDKFQRAVVIRNTRLSDYDFSVIPAKEFRGHGLVSYDPQARMRDGSFWAANRQFQLGVGEGGMDDFMRKLSQTKNFGWALFGIKAFLENYVETGSSKTPSKLDLGPVTAMVSRNEVDGLRFRFGGKTTAHFNPHFFLEGYYAKGNKSGKHYYGAKATYSLNKKAYMPHEFPMRTISLESSSDVMAASDKYLKYGKDNVFLLIRPQKTKYLYFYNRQLLNFTWETDYGLKADIELKLEQDKPAGKMTFQRMSDGLLLDKMRTTELRLGLTYQAGQTFITSKEQRFEVNQDATRLSFSHTMGFSNFLGGQYRHHYSELSLRKRFWLGSWGFIDTQGRVGVEWCKVPFPLLAMPPVNTSIFEQQDAFSTMENMEFLNDRMAQLTVAWTLNGKLFNRIPLLHKLKWREYVAMKAMWGKLSDKNNPMMPPNQHDAILFHFPEGCHVMNHEPYLEMVVGIQNIFKFLEIDYVRRLTYTAYPDISIRGVRIGFHFVF